MKTKTGWCAVVTVVIAGQLVALAQMPQVEPAGREGGHTGMRPPHAGGPGMGMRPPHDGGPGMGGDIAMEQGMLGRFLMHPKAAEELGLTPEQVKTLKEQSEPLRTEMETLRKELEQASMEQAKLLTGNSVEEEALMAAVEKTAAVRLKMAKLAMRQLLLVKRTLTPEQVAKAREMMRERLNRRPSEGADGGPRGEAFRRRMQEREGKMPPPDRPPRDPEALPPAGPQI
jgi:Spy/CpxP family protein refolding chaperone